MRTEKEKIKAKGLKYMQIRAKIKADESMGGGIV
jgi:hypothetical protein